MPRFTHISLWGVLFFLFLDCYSFSQTDEYEFRHITTEDGLSSNHINAIFKDSRGFMWFGTDEGLNRFDGYTVKVFKTKPGDSTSISGNNVTAIIEESNGDLLVGTSSNGLNLFHVATGKFTRYKDLPGIPECITENQINTFYRESQDLFWIGTNRGFIVYDHSSGVFEHFQVNPDNPGDSSNYVTAFLKENTEKIWIGTLDGLFLFNPVNGIFDPLPLVPDWTLNWGGDNGINSIFRDSDGKIWVGTYWFLYTFENGQIEWIGPPNSFIYKSDYAPNNYDARPVAERLSHDRRYLWMFSKGGMERYDFTTRKFLHILPDTDDPKSINSYWLTSMYADTIGLLWIGTNNLGVNVVNINKNRFERHRTRSYYSASSFFLDSNDELLVGLSDGGLQLRDAGMNVISYYPVRIPGEAPANNSHIYNIYEDSNHKLWIANDHFTNQGLYLFNREQGYFKPVATSGWLKHSSPREGDRVYVNSFMEEKSGKLWLGTSHGLYRCNTSDPYEPTHIPVRVNDSMTHFNVWDLLIDKEEVFVIATNDHGLFVMWDVTRLDLDCTFLDANMMTNLEFDGVIRDIYEDHSGVLWLGTSRGLFRLNLEDTTLVPATRQEGHLLNSSIYKIAEDKSNNLWMNTQAGLIQFNPEDSSRSAVKLYRKSDGLPFDQFNERAFYQDGEGRIFIGAQWASANGFLLFKPDNIRINTNIPDIVITDFKVNQQSFQLDSAISYVHHIYLDYDQNFFSFEFAALDYINPGLNQYSYYLEGLEEDWIEAGNRRYANYTDVAPGNYVFRVKGSNNDGYWNEIGTSVVITILPPPWRTWWAYTLYGLLLVGLLFGWRRYDLRRQRLKQALEIEHVEAEKLKELDNLKSRFFANISHEFRTPLTLILGPLEKLRSIVSDKEGTDDLNVMQRNALRLQNLINQILSLTKLEAGQMKLQAQELNLVKLVNGYVQSFESLAKQKNIDLEFNSEEDEIQVYVDQEKLEKILFNLLSNAFKFTPEKGKITIGITMSPRHHVTTDKAQRNKGTEAQNKKLTSSQTHKLTISVSDTGSGIPPEKLPHIFDRFYQADDSYTMDQEGSGIGLALTKELVELHHGTISVESEIGKGTTFTISIPLGIEHLENEEIFIHDDYLNKEQKTKNKQLELLKVENRHSKIENQKDPSLTLPLEGRRIILEPRTLNLEPEEVKPLLLIIEDNADLREYIRSYLDESYRVEEAINGIEGLSIAIETIPDLIISDVMMPEMDGFELCGKLKTDERTSHIPVILLTARAGQESKLEGLETGADDYITKPFDANELLIRIKNLLETRRKLKERFRKHAGESGLDRIIDLPDSDISSMEQKFLKKAMEIINANLSDPDFTVKKFCSEMAMSNMQLHRKLVAVTGQTANRLIRSYRLSHAARLLEKRAGNVTEVAYDVGFNNLSWFAKCFQEQFGLSPSEYQSKKSSL